MSDDFNPRFIGEYPRYSVRFGVRYPDFTTFNEDVISHLVFALQPVFSWETLFILIARRFADNEFLAQVKTAIDNNMQEALDRLIPKYNKIWDINASDYINNLTTEQMLQQGLIKEVMNEDIDETKDLVNLFKESPQELDAGDLDLDYLTSKGEVNDVINRVVDLTRDTENSTVPIYERFFNFTSQNITYEFERFYSDLMEIFIKYKKGGYPYEYE